MRREHENAVWSFTILSNDTMNGIALCSSISFQLSLGLELLRLMEREDDRAISNNKHEIFVRLHNFIVSFSLSSALSAAGGKGFASHFAFISIRDFSCHELWRGASRAAARLCIITL